MSSSFRRATSASVLFLALGLGCQAKGNSSSAQALASVEQASAPAPDLLAESLWSDNQTYVYALSVASSTGLVGALPLAQYDMQGDLVVYARKLGGRAVQLAVSVSSPTFRTQNEGAVPKYDALASELAAPYLITLTDGAIAEERIAKGVSPYAESILRYLGAALQLRAAKGHEGLKATERDLTGTYHASYDSDASGESIVRKKLSYEPLTVTSTGPNPRTSTLSTTVKDSKTTIKLSPQALQTLESEETLSTPVANGSGVSSSTRFSLKFKAASATVTVLPWDDLVARTVTTEAGQMVAKAGETSQFDALRIGDYTFEKALSELTRSAKRDGARSSEERGKKGRPPALDPETQKQEIAANERAFTAMVALLRKDPKHIDSALQLIDKKDAAFKHLLDALSSAGTPQAQQALVLTLKNPKLDLPVRQRSAIALTRVSVATPESVAALSSLLHERGFETVASYGLGTLSRRIRESGDFARADGIVETLLKELEGGKSDDVTAIVLRGISNSGSAKAFSAVEPFLGQSSARVREAAVEAIRLMLDPRVDNVLKTVLASETDDAVRVAALDACSMRPMTESLLQIVTSAGHTGKSTRVRQKAIQVLAHWAPQSPEAAASLRAMTALETNPNVQREAAAAERRVGG